ncbi:protein FAR1-RELATED SEQUENCE 5 [Prunus yedoensis var. nudiflora]|uniref:Protein FAR1-RELATED SEQUENCE 5 n=1 Tax=Prunus yedoensis var. nudiflora TaxID=2094558 RepID=A0A314UXI8_PRUYE|nr:protein FAR1-RELATED SEQUENCE 5 [Prunus yedoensis var. nudiflora]
MQHSTYVDSICVPTTKVVPTPLSRFSQAQSSLDGEFGLFSSQFTSAEARSYNVGVDPPFLVDKSHQAS